MIVLTLIDTYYYTNLHISSFLYTRDADFIFVFDFITTYIKT